MVNEPFRVGRADFRLVFDFSIMISCFKEDLENKKIIDFGTGSGWIAEWLNRMGFEVTAVDIERGSTHHCRMRSSFDRRINPESLNCSCADGHRLPFRTGTMGHICCFDTLHHMRDYREVFFEFYRVLASGGRAIFVEPGAKHASSPETIEFINRYKKDDPNWIERNVVLEEINELAEECGFRRMVLKPSLAPELREYDLLSWQRFMHGDRDLEGDYLNWLKTYNYESRVIFYFEKGRAGKAVYPAVQPPAPSPEAVRPSLLDEVRSLQGRLKEEEADREVARKRIQELSARVESFQAKLAFSHSILDALRSGRVFRLLRQVGLWKEMEAMMANALADTFPLPRDCASEAPRLGADSPLPTRFSRIAVDLSPLLPGGENGGAKMVAIDLVRGLSRLLPDCEFVLLTSYRSHEEIAYLDSSNVRRLCISSSAAPGGPPSSRAIRMRGLRVRLTEILAGALPGFLFARMKTAYRRLRSRHRPRNGTLAGLKADLLFCPFTMPFFYDPAVPVVSIVYDLQYRYYPQFFEADDYAARERNFKETCRLADRIICISEFVRRTVLENSSLIPDQVVSIPIRLAGRLPAPKPENIGPILAKHGLHGDDFLFYPSNFWPHKNHSMLFTAFGMFRARHPESNLRLVCTGAPDGRMEVLRGASVKMGLGERISFPGYISDEEFAVLLASCRALIFPSLYEGFGMPILEAMAFGKPVLCSNLASLPEVAGDAAFFFDPKKPQEILQAVEEVVYRPQAADLLRKRGEVRVSQSGDAERMAQEYLEEFRKARERVSPAANVLHGIYSDGWTGGQVILKYGTSPEERTLEMIFHVPPFHPHEEISVTVHDGKGKVKGFKVRRNHSLPLRVPLFSHGGLVELRFHPIFHPRAVGINPEDDRWLGCQCQGGSIQCKDRREFLLPMETMKESC